MSLICLHNFLILSSARSWSGTWQGNPNTAISKGHSVNNGSVCHQHGTWHTIHHIPTMPELTRGGSWLIFSFPTLDIFFTEFLATLNQTTPFSWSAGARAKVKISSWTSAKLYTSENLYKYIKSFF